MTNDKTDHLPEWICGKADCTLLRLKVTPRSSATEITGYEENRLKIRLKAPPVDGKANKELTSFFSALLKIPKKYISIESGQGSRLKCVAVRNVAPRPILEAVVRSAGPLRTAPENEPPETGTQK